MLDLAHDAGEGGAARFKRGLAQILAVELKEVERIQEHRPVVPPPRSNLNEGTPSTSQQTASPSIRHEWTLSAAIPAR